MEETQNWSPASLEFAKRGITNPDIGPFLTTLAADLANRKLKAEKIRVADGGLNTENYNVISVEIPPQYTNGRQVDPLHFLVPKEFVQGGMKVTGH